MREVTRHAVSSMALNCVIHSFRLYIVHHNASTFSDPINNLRSLIQMNIAASSTEMKANGN